MNHTQNYQLSQWEATDKVQRTDFNADNAKIDAAISKCGNCRVRVSTYIGDGEQTRTHTFDRTPVLIGIAGGGNFLWAMPGETSTTILRSSPFPVKLNWGEDSVAISRPGGSPDVVCNVKDTNYVIIFFEDASAD